MATAEKKDYWRTFQLTHDLLTLCSRYSIEIWPIESSHIQWELYRNPHPSFGWNQTFGIKYNYRKVLNFHYKCHLDATKELYPLGSPGSIKSTSIKRVRDKYSILLKYHKSTIRIVYFDNSNGCMESLSGSESGDPISFYLDQFEPLTHSTYAGAIICIPKRYILSAKNKSNQINDPIFAKVNDVKLNKFKDLLSHIEDPSEGLMVTNTPLLQFSD